jgi:hypothetical protein
LYRLAGSAPADFFYHIFYSRDIDLSAAVSTDGWSDNLCPLCNNKKYDGEMSMEEIIKLATSGHYFITALSTMGHNNISIFAEKYRPCDLTRAVFMLR